MPPPAEKNQIKAYRVDQLIGIPVWTIGEEDGQTVENMIIEGPGG